MLGGNLFSMQDQFFRRVSASRAAVSKRTQWQARGNKYLAAYPSLQRRGSLIQVDTDLQRQIAGYIEDLFPALSRAFNRHLVPVAQKAFDE